MRCLIPITGVAAANSRSAARRDGLPSCSAARFSSTPSSRSTGASSDDLAGPLNLTGEIIVAELVISFKLTLVAIVSLLVFRALLPQNRWSRSVAVLLPVYLWGLEATQLQRTFLYSGGTWTPHFLLFQLWLVSIVAGTPLAFVLLSAILHSCGRQPGRRPRRVVRIGAGTVLAATVVVTTVLLDWLLFSLVIGESVAEKIP